MWAKVRFEPSGAGNFLVPPGGDIVEEGHISVSQCVASSCPADEHQAATIGFGGPEAREDCRKKGSGISDGQQTVEIDGRKRHWSH